MISLGTRVEKSAGPMLSVCCVLFLLGCRGSDGEASSSQAEEESASVASDSSSKDSSAPSTSTDVDPPTDETSSGDVLPDGVQGTVSNEGTYFVTCSSTPAPIPMNQPFEMTVQVFRASDRSTPLTNVSVYADGDMPAHGHGMNTDPQVEPTADGKYHVTGMLFHMLGHWEIYVDIMENGVTERAQFDVNLE